MQPEIITLKNGFRIAVAKQPQMQTATVMLFTKTGSRNETAELNGASHFLEHLLFKGTKSYPTPKKLAEAFDSIGAEHNAYTSKEHTAYYAKVLAKHTPTALELLASMFLEPRIPSSELERERGVVIEEINMYEDLPMHSIDDVFEAALFGADTPLGRTILGPKENIKRLSRKELLAYKENNYDASRSLLVLAGNVPAKAIVQAKRLFSALPQKPRTDTPQPLPKHPHLHIAHKQKQVDQTHLYLGFPTFARGDAREYPLALLQTILGGGMSSRLFMEVREKRGLAYYVSAVSEQFTETGYLAVRAGVTNEKLPEAIEAIKHTITKLTKTTIPESELAKAKEQLLSSLSFTLDSSDGLASYVGKQLLLKEAYLSPASLARRIRRITAQEIKTLAAELFQQPPVLAVIGPNRVSEEIW